MHYIYIYIYIYTRIYIYIYTLGKVRFQSTEILAREIPHAGPAGAEICTCCIVLSERVCIYIERERE